jgi:hypothetical protein
VYRLCQAYVGLVLAPTAKDGSRTTSVARYGVYEVRLFELASQRSLDTGGFWIELYRHDTHASLDTFLCHDLDEGEPVVEEFILSAKQLHESQHGSQGEFGPSPSLSPGSFCASSS